MWAFLPRIVVSVPGDNSAAGALPRTSLLAKRSRGDFPNAAWVCLYVGVLRRTACSCPSFIVNPCR